MGIFNHPVGEGEKWRTVKWTFKYRGYEFVQIGAVCFLIWYYKKYEIDRYCSKLNQSAMFGGRTKSLEKPELVGCTDVKFIQFAKKLDQFESGKQ